MQELPETRRTRRRHFQGWSVLTAVLFCLLCTGFARADVDTVLVVANPSVTDEQVSRSFLRSVFGMRTRKWPSGAPIKVFVLRDSHPLHEKFSKSVLKTFPYNLRRIWDTRVFSGTGQYPLLVDDIEEMHRMLSTIDYAVGYLPSSAVNESVKTLGIKD